METTGYPQNSQNKPESAKTRKLRPLIEDLIIFLEEEIEEAEKSIPDEGILFPNEEEEKEFYEQRRSAARAYVVQDYEKQALKFLKHLKENYKAELWAKKDWKAPRWLQQGEIGKALKNTRFYDVFNYLHDNTMTHEKGSKLVDKQGWGKYARGGKENEYVLVLPDYARMAATLSMKEQSLPIKEQSLRLYVSRFVDMDILRPLGKEGPRGQKIYAIGFWSHYGEGEGEQERGRSKRNWFLKETCYLKEMLSNFTVRDEDERLAKVVKKYRTIRDAIRDLNESGLAERKLRMDEAGSERELRAAFMAIAGAVPVEKQGLLSRRILDLVTECMEEG